MSTTTKLFALAAAAALYGCSNDDSTNLRSARVSPKARHADAVVAEGQTKDLDVGAKDEKQQIPQDTAHQVDPTPTVTGTGDSPGTASPAAPVIPAEKPEEVWNPAVGMRNFRQINDVMSVLTGVPRTNANVTAAFALLETALPDSNDIRTFNGSHQVAISKLAVEYCDAMVEDPALSALAIPGFNFAALPNVAFDAAGKATVGKALVAKFWGSGLDSLPPEAELVETLSDLIDAVVAGKANTAVITKNVVKGVCVSLLASSQVLLY